MANRITGLNSGLDTESLITALTQKYQDKVDKTKGNQKKLQWKRDEWKTLNSKVTKFFNSTLSPLRFSDAFNKKVTKASNSSAVSIVSSSVAMNTTQTMKVDELAKSAYLTGGQVTGGNDAGATLASLGIADGTLKFKMGGNDADTIEINVTSDMTLRDVASKISSTASTSGKNISANYDATQQRFYIGAKEEGKDASFELDTAGSSSALVSALGLDSGNYIRGEDAQITLNGVPYTSKNNVFSVNGLTITAKEKTDDTFTISTTNDTSGIYDMVKNFFKEYNALVNEFDKLYNSDSAKKYSMLTDDMKKQMSEDDVKDWEKKIKDGLFSKDETLYTLKSAMREVMNGSYKITNKDGIEKELSLSSFGINTLSYYKATENERNYFHINGDKDDAAVSSEDDMLAAMIASDPDMVTDFFTNLSQDLYGKMNKLMAGTKYRSAYTIYEDKLMASQYSDYNTQISNAEKALTAKQDFYYDKFARMEKLMAKLNSTSSSLSGFFGGGT